MSEKKSSPINKSESLNVEAHVADLNQNNSLRKIGKITGIHGLRGEVFVYVFSKDVSWIENLKEMTLENTKDNSRHLFQVRSLRPFKEGFLVFLDGINDRTDAEKLRGRLVYVDGVLFETESGDETFYLAEIENFNVFDRENLIGTIQGFGSNTVQDLLLVKCEWGIVEIPLIEEFLTDINFEKKEIHMELPEGLIEVQRPAT